ncbi:MAG: type II secretion system F family protein [Deltaproteobacteria bacterium]
MPKFSYIARKGSGERDSGIIDALSQDEAVIQLQQKDLIVTSIIPLELSHQEASGAPKMSLGKKKGQFTHSGVRPTDMVVFARQLALLLGSGVSLLRSLDIISKQVDSKKLFAVIGQVRQDMEGGRTLRDALAKFPVHFNALWLNLVETGEASGNLPMVLEKLAYYLEEEMSFRRKIISALLYPGILLFISVSAVLFFVLKIVPTFATILDGFGVPLPMATKVVIGVSNFLLHKFFILAGAIAGLFFLFKHLNNQPHFRRIFEDTRLKLPVMGEFFRFLLLERFTTTMSILVESGVPILYALEISERSAGCLRMSESIAFIKKNVKEGRTMAEPMEKIELFTPMIIQMVAIGEEIGELTNMLKRVSKYYQDYLETFVARLATIFEPLMIVFVGIIIGSMVIAIFLPIFSLATSKPT